MEHTPTFLPAALILVCNGEIIRISSEEKLKEFQAGADRHDLTYWQLTETDAIKILDAHETLTADNASMRADLAALKAVNAELVKALSGLTLEADNLCGASVISISENTKKHLKADVTKAIAALALAEEEVRTESLDMGLVDSSPTKTISRALIDKAICESILEEETTERAYLMLRPRGYCGDVNKNDMLEWVAKRWREASL